MREIKFRAWDKKRGKMYEVVSLFTSNNNKDFAGNFVEIGYSDMDYKFIDYEKENIILIQFTGLKDNNGKEIYEGDVVDWDDYIEGIKNNIVCIVKWNNMDSKYELYSPEFDKIVNFTILSINKIIGNIYENPELLEDAK